MKKFLILLAFLSLNKTSGLSQNCYDASFESGTTSGYKTYIGQIEQDGTVTINTERSEYGRHTIMHILDETDSIAYNHCLINKILPVVPKGSGQFALKLGNERNGAEAERILMKMHVTESTNFFLLRYAVLLQDPEHEEFEQPRFELRILDNNGKVFPCGEYKVRADRKILGFENCGIWRVRPWTTVGFELNSYIGQDIQIEILTTDCALSGHAGYAYLDATCKPLEIKIKGYCKDSLISVLSVTEGFEKYKWSTGDSTSSIIVKNPTQGETYTVTVTSATGCSITLSDTIPAIEEHKLPMFDPAEDKVICSGNSIWFLPTGKNLNEINWIEYDYTADSFLLKPITSSKYHFVSQDKFGCVSDTLTLNIEVINDSTKIIGPKELCLGDSITLCADGGSTIATYEWHPINLTGIKIKISPTQSIQYEILIKGTNNCIFKKIHTVFVKQPLPINISPVLDTFACTGKDFKLFIKAENISSIFWPDLNSKSNNIPIDVLNDTSFRAILVEPTGCDTFEHRINIKLKQKPQVELGLDQCFLDPVKLSAYSEHADSYLWQDFSSDSIYLVNETGYYYVAVNGSCGTSRDSVYLQEDFNHCKSFLPNIISTSSLVNNIFKPTFTCEESLYEDYQFEIFDRWGKIVYHSNNSNQTSWNPDKYSPGVYIWRLKYYNRFCDVNKQFSGDVTLVE